MLGKANRTFDWYELGWFFDTSFTINKANLLLIKTKVIVIAIGITEAIAYLVTRSKSFWFGFKFFDSVSS